MRTRIRSREALPLLQNARHACKHIDSALRKGNRERFLLALRDVVEANGGMTKVSRLSKLSRESLYRMLSKYGNPEIKSLSTLLKALGLRMCVTSDGFRL